jgi:hypothetical protein
MFGGNGSGKEKSNQTKYSTAGEQYPRTRCLMNSAIVLVGDDGMRMPNNIVSTKIHLFLVVSKNSK